MAQVFIVRQTVLHLPNSIQLYGHSICGSLQLGDPSVIANQTGIITVGDFRTADIALGGQGAPLVPYLDHMLLRRHFLKTGRVGVFLNIGGISNIFSGAIADTDEGYLYYRHLGLNVLIMPSQIQNALGLIVDLVMYSLIV